MPLPKPNSGESQDDFISRCMSNETAKNDFPDNDQRLAVCFSQWKDKSAEPEVVRAWAVLTTKSLDEDQRVVEGIATSPEPDRVNDIVEPLGAKYDLPMPLLLHHDFQMPVGSVEVVKKSAKNITFRARIPKVDEPGRLKDRIDEAWHSLKHGLIRGVSIGFRPLEQSFLDKTGGMRYTSWEWVETSLVTVPANALATITTIKSFDSAQSAASGTKADLSSHPGVSGATSKIVPKEARMARTVAEQISAFEASRAAKSARMTEIMSSDTGETLDQAASEEYDGLADEIAAIDKHLKRLDTLQATQVTKAKPVNGDGSKDASESRSSVVTVQARDVALPPGIEFARYVKCMAAARGNTQQAYEISKNWYPDQPRIQNVLKTAAMNGGLSEEIVRKAPIQGGTTTDGQWASALVDYTRFAGDFIEFLRPQTIVGKFGQGGIPSLRNVPFNIQIPAQLSGGQGYWVGEGRPKPLTKFNFGRIELRWAKVANIAVLTDELVRFSNPSAEALVRDALAAAIIERIDIDFVDPAKTAVANVSPASITNGAPNYPSSGQDAAAIAADVQLLMQNMMEANMPVSSGVWIMNSRIALGLSLMKNALGQPEFNTISMNGGSFLGFPVITSDYVRDVVFVIANEIYLADDGQVTVDASREASLEMLDNPTNNTPTPTATAMVSMFQTNSIALRAERYINWQRRRAEAVAYLTNVDWGGSGLSGT